MIFPYLCILFFIVIFILFSNKTKENFITFYIPKEVNIINKYPEYAISPALRSMQKHFPSIQTTVFHFYLPPDIENHAHIDWFKGLLKQLLQRQSYYPLNFKIHTNINEWIENITNAKIPNIGAIPLTILETLRATDSRVNSLQGVLSLYTMSLFIIVPYEIGSLGYEWNRNFLRRIRVFGLGPEHGLASQWMKKILNTYTSIETEGQKYTHGNYEDLLNDFEKGRIDALVWTDTTLGPRWTHIQRKLPVRSYGLIEIRLTKNNNLQWNDPNIRSTYFNLAMYNLNYVPTTLGAKTYTFFSPMMETIGTPYLLVATPNFPKDDIYYWLKRWFETESYKNNEWFKASHWTIAQGFDFGTGISIHSGSAQWMIEHGLLSAQASNECKNWVGNTRCPIPNIL